MKKLTNMDWRPGRRDASRWVAVIALLAIMPALAAASGGNMTWELLKIPVTQLLGLLMTIFGVPLLIKWGRKLGIEIDEQSALDAVQALINIIVNIENAKAGLSGSEKKAAALAMAQQSLSAPQKAILVKKYGTLEAAVQVAYERSSLNNKGAK